MLQQQGYQGLGITSTTTRAPMGLHTPTAATGIGPAAGHACACDRSLQGPQVVGRVSYGRLNMIRVSLPQCGIRSYTYVHVQLVVVRSPGRRVFWYNNLHGLNLGGAEGNCARPQVFCKKARQAQWSTGWDACMHPCVHVVCTCECLCQVCILTHGM